MAVEMVRRPRAGLEWATSRLKLHTLHTSSTIYIHIIKAISIFPTSEGASLLLNMD